MFKYSRPTPQKRDWFDTSVADSYESDESESSCISSPDTYFERERHDDIAPTFPFTLASSIKIMGSLSKQSSIGLKRGKEPDGDRIVFHYADNIMRIAG